MWTFVARMGTASRFNILESTLGGFFRTKHEKHMFDSIILDDFWDAKYLMINHPKQTHWLASKYPKSSGKSHFNPPWSGISRHAQWMSAWSLASRQCHRDQPVCHIGSWQNPIWAVRSLRRSTCSNFNIVLLATKIFAGLVDHALSFTYWFIIWIGFIIHLLIFAWFTYGLPLGFRPSGWLSINKRNKGYLSFQWWRAWLSNLHISFLPTRKQPSNFFVVGGWATPLKNTSQLGWLFLKKIGVRQLGWWLATQYIWENAKKWQPNHQPVLIHWGPISRRTKASDRPVIGWAVSASHWHQKVKTIELIPSPYY